MVPSQLLDFSVLRCTLNLKKMIKVTNCNSLSLKLHSWCCHKMIAQSVYQSETETELILMFTEGGHNIVHLSYGDKK